MTRIVVYRLNFNLGHSRRLWWVVAILLHGPLANQEEIFLRFLSILRVYSPGVILIIEFRYI